MQIQHSHVLAWKFYAWTNHIAARLCHRKLEATVIMGTCARTLSSDAARVCLYCCTYYFWCIFRKPWTSVVLVDVITLQLHVRSGVDNLKLRNFIFLSRVSTLTRDIDIANLSVRYVPVSDENGLTYRQSFFTIRYPNHSVFISIKHLHEIPKGSPPAGAIDTGGA